MVVKDRSWVREILSKKDVSENLRKAVTVVKRNGQLVKLEFCQSVVHSFVYHSSRR